jgi:hypothetical protein
LVDVADRDQHRAIGHGSHKGVHERHVDHRGLIDHQQVAPQRIPLVPSEAAVPGIDLEQPMNGLGRAGRRRPGGGYGRAGAPPLSRRHPAEADVNGECCEAWVVNVTSEDGDGAPPPLASAGVVVCLMG